MESEITELKKTLSSMEMELKANRGTIARLAAEAEQKHTNSSEYLSQIQNFMKEREQQELIKKDLITKIDELKAANERKQDEVLTLTKQMRNLTESITSTENNVSEANSSFKNFRLQLLKLLFGFEDEKLTNEFILKKISELKECESESRILKKENERFSTILKEIPDEHEKHKVKTKLKNFEADISEMTASLEKKKKQEEKMIKFITSLGNSLGVHKEELGSDIDPLMEAILFRSRQLYRNEGSLVTDQKTQIYSLQRKIKSLNEMLTSKNFHLDLLKRKLSSLEEHKFNKSDFEKEKDEACVKTKKLMKLVENYKKELAQSTREIKDLREKLQAALLLADENQGREDKLEELVVQKLDLETLCRELNSKIESLKKDKNDGKRVKERIKEEHERKLKSILEELEQKSSTILKLEEYIKQCNIFKQKLSEMLSEDLPLQEKSFGKVAKVLLYSGNVVSNKNAELSEEEIISRMKILIETSRQNAATAYVLDSALADMAEGLKVGYHKAALNVNNLPKPATLGSFERSLKNFISHPSS